MMCVNEKIVSLYKHWVTADSISQVISKRIGSNNSLPEKIAEMAEIYSSILRLTVFYGLIYVVIEGYQELKLSNKRIDKLLKKSDFVYLLRRFRNATFHYQENSITEKELEFLELKESENWVQDIHKAFRAYFEETFHVKDLLNKTMNL